MPQEPRPTPRPTPALDRLLERLRRRLVGLVWMHGLSTAVGATAVWLAVAFLVDWSLHVPAGIRWIHLAVLAIVPGVLLVRELARPLRKLPLRADLAVLIERAHPDLKELVVSAAELARAERADGAPELISDVLARAEARAPDISLDGVLDPSGPRRRLALGGCAAIATALLLGLNAGPAGIFLDRLFGGNSAWPRRTTLVVEVPLPGALHTSEAALGAPEPTELRVKVARGQDVPITVRAIGVVPDEVVLQFRSGERAVIASSGGPVFRTLLRSLQEDAEFCVTGGDDEDEVPWVRLNVLQPPDIETLAIAITPPAYSGLAPRVEFDRDVEVLAGSRLVIHARTTPADARGSVRILPEDRVLELAPRNFPTSGAEASGESIAGLACDLVAEKNLRFRFELTDSTGLANPDPGLFAVTVVEDRAPEVEVLSPSRAEFDTLRTGLIALRARAEDDFGLAELAWTSTAAGEDGSRAAPTPRPLEWRLLEPEEARAADDAETARVRGRQPRAVAIGRSRIEVVELFGTESATDGQQFQLVVTALDNADPGAHTGKSSPVRVRVVTSDEFVRRLQDRLARVQALVNALTELQREKSRRTSELLSVFESDQLEPKGADAEIGQLATGQRRVQGDARNLARELCAVCETVLYSRLDDRGGVLLDFLDARLANSVRKSFDPNPWIDLAGAAQRGELGQGALSSRLVDIVGLALEVSEVDTREAAAAMGRAQQASDVAETHRELGIASGHEKLALEKLDKLLEKLAEWDNFQSVLALTHDLLQGQKSLQERTRASFKEK